jgi:hypothetical protein
MSWLRDRLDVWWLGERTDRNQTRRHFGEVACHSASIMADTESGLTGGFFVP